MTETLEQIKARYALKNKDCKHIKGVKINQETDYDTAKRYETKTCIVCGAEISNRFLGYI